MMRREKRMIEIKEKIGNAEGLALIAESAARYKQIVPLVKAWAKIDADSIYTEQQKNMCCAATLYTILQIIEGQ